jgi:hypothetical protein
LLGAELGWSPAHQQEQQDSFINLIQRNIDRAGLSANRRELVAGV